MTNEDELRAEAARLRRENDALRQRELESVSSRLAVAEASVRYWQKRCEAFERDCDRLEKLGREIAAMYEQLKRKHLTLQENTAIPNGRPTLRTLRSARRQRQSTGN